MARGEFFPIVACTDIPRAMAFYEAVLGAVERYRFPAEGPPVYVAMKLGSSSLGLGDGNDVTGYGARPLPSTGYPVDLCVYVDDLDATFDEAPRHGGAVIKPAQDMPWGERAGWICDPEGVMIMVIRADD